MISGIWSFGPSLTSKTTNMKTLALILSLLISGIIANAQDTEGVSISVTIENVASNDGQILAALHTSETFMKGPGVQNYMNDAKEGHVTFNFKNVKPGLYAISTMHDSNENQQMDFDNSGMPIEKYGMSTTNIFMGPPTFQDAQFEVANEDLEIIIRL